MRIRRLKSEEFASCKTCKIYRLSLYSEKTNMYPKLIPVTPIKFEHLYSPGFVILSASDLSTCFIKNPLLFHIKMSVPDGATLPIDFMVIVTFSPFRFHAMSNTLCEKILSNENAIYWISL